MVVDGVVVLVVVVGIVVILSVVVVVVVVVEVLVVDGMNVVRMVDRVVAALVVRLGNIEVVVGGVVVDGVVQVLADVLLDMVNASAIDLAVVVITRPRAATVVPVVTVGAMVVDVVEATRGASRNCAMSRGSVPSIAPAFRIECCLMLSASVGVLLARRRAITEKLKSLKATSLQIDRLPRIPA